MPELVVVAMSGGVDSSVTAFLLKERGYRVIGVTLNVWPEQSVPLADSRRSACCSLDAVEDARRVADLIGIPHYTLNFRDLFDKFVIQDFVTEYSRGRTPNPCIRCNRFIKFDALQAKAEAWGADYLATGHYARIGRSPEGRFTLSKALDAGKDQSYALYPLTQRQLGRTLFPLGGIEKENTRKLAASLGMATAYKPDSQEICFVPEDNHAAFLRGRLPASHCPGPLLSRRGEHLGYHPGIAYFTVGQRRGLGVATGTPLYVVEIVPEENAVVLGEKEELYSTGLLAEDLNWVSVARPPGALEAQAKIRYRAEPVPCVARTGSGGMLAVEFAEPQKAVTPGQAVVLYDNDQVLGGGTIVRAVSG